jgi:low molecular weight protein-tyrosine phosphatase
MKKILFVCLGNICRSPAAEGIMKRVIEDADLENSFEVDSAGTIAYHAGEGADERMKHHASKRGYDLTSIARRFNPAKDFENFDYIIAMDNDNYYNIKSMDEKDKYDDKIYKMTQFCTRHDDEIVPDPYYLGAEGFENVLDILEDACDGLLEKLKNEDEQRNKKTN